MKFKDTFVLDHPATPESLASKIPPTLAGVKGFVELMQEFNGSSFENGLYRIHKFSNLARWTRELETIFPSFKGRMLCFSYDWLGRHFAIDFDRRVAGEYQVLLFEPGTGQVLEIPSSFAAFHDSELLVHRNEALASDFHKSWISSGGKSPGLSECIGYKSPLFLGGQDSLDNLELSDMDVYWALCGQLLARTSSLPDGMRINRINLS